MKAVNVDEAVEILNVQIAAIRAFQKALLAKKQPTAMAMGKMTSMAMTLARGLAAYQAELRKMEDKIEEQLKNLTPEREAHLALRLITRLSPEHRAAARLHIDSLNGKLISHAGSKS